MKYAIVDFRITTEEESKLRNLGCEILICPPSEFVYDAISGHPDILLHIIDNHTIMVHNRMNKSFINTLKILGFNIVFSKNSLQTKYPHDVILNSLNLSNMFVHNLNFTDPNLLSYVSSKKLINVKQGYTKCSTAIVSDNAAITSDKSIASALLKENIDVLLIPPGDILLPGLNYGFIGGCCGLIDENTLAFYGNLNHYAYGDKVTNFLKKHGMAPVFLGTGKLVDRGSIFILDR